MFIWVSLALVSRLLCSLLDAVKNYNFLRIVTRSAGDGSSPQACTEVYRGSKPASELETQGIIQRLTELKDKLILYLSLHSFGQYILTPYGFARYQYPKNYKNMVSTCLCVFSVLLVRTILVF